MRIQQAAFIIPLAIALPACVVPVVDNKETTPANCHTYTKSMSLEVVGGNITGCHSNDCAVAVLAVFAGSAIISGSIVLTNNTVHWLEYQGSCSDSFLNIAKQRFLDSLDHPKPISANWQQQ